MSTLFLRHDIEHVSGNCHAGGSPAVIADDLDAARILLREQAAQASDMWDSRFIPVECEAYTEEPDCAYPLRRKEAPRVFTFPNAGCC